MLKNPTEYSYIVMQNASFMTMNWEKRQTMNGKHSIILNIVRAAKQRAMLNVMEPRLLLLHSLLIILRYFLCSIT